MARPRTSLLRAVAALALAALAGAASAGDVYVVANGPLALSADEIKEIFLGEVQFAGAQKLSPIDNASAQGDFIAHVLKMTAPRYTAWWTKKSFRDGVNPPPVRASDTQVLMFVRETPGAIGYLGSAPPPGVHVVGKF